MASKKTYIVRFVETEMKKIKALRDNLEISPNERDRFVELLDRLSYKYRNEEKRIKKLATSKKKKRSKKK